MSGKLTEEKRLKKEEKARKQKSNTHVGYNFGTYYLPEGRDPIINNYRESRISLLKTIENKKLKGNEKSLLKDIEEALNLLFYPEQNGALDLLKANEYKNALRDLSLQAVGIETTDVLYASIEDGIATVGGSNQLSKDIQTKFIDRSSKSKNQIEWLFEKRMQRLTQTLIKTYTKMGDQDTVNKINSEMEKIGELLKEAQDEFISQGVSKSENPMVYRNSEKIFKKYFKTYGHSVSDKIRNAFTMMSTLSAAYGGSEVNYTQLGGFFEQNLKEFFSGTEKDILDNTSKGVLDNILKNVSSAERTGAVPVKMANGTNLVYKQEIDTTRLPNRTSLTGKNNNKIHANFRSGGYSFKFEINTTQSFDWENEKQQKSDVVVELNSGEYLGISAKNWGSFYNEDEEKHSGQISYQILSGIAQTFNSGDAVFSFLKMLQDKDTDQKPVHGGKYVGAEAVNSAKQMAILGTFVGGFMGINQSGRGTANTMIINNRQLKHIYVFDLSNMVYEFVDKIIQSNNLIYDYDFTHSLTSEKIRIKLLDADVQKLNKLAVGAHSLSNRVTKSQLQNWLLGFLHSEKLSFAFELK